MADIRDLLPKFHFDLDWLRFGFSSDFSDDFDADPVIQPEDLPSDTAPQE